MKQFLHRVLTVVFAAFIFIGAQAFGYGNALQAFADDTVESPIGIYYKGTPDESAPNKTNTAVEGGKSKLKSTFDNLRGTAKDAVNSTKKGIDDAAKSTGDTVKSPLGTYYKGTPHASLPLETDTKSVDTKNPLQSIADNVREKLNLDEPLPESTKEFLGSTEKRVEKAVEPITGTK
ncbi:hypothetical protein NIES4075_27590 [Tolypothrix sp. NIES-4075]|uniref:hypothetical protein n=1 Tax=Tolypothrix sp. NIES-4075 TaxID=2005459 RepID=UPI000B6EE714|nr:hypothetical protein [Tolypothrix sp. NIES-4075]GAX41762.1 hypothetical protein NIES4075_27590 [Tolypothrix sp. NIES-4075]